MNHFQLYRLTLPEQINLGTSANNGTLRPSTSMDRWMILHDIALVIVPYFIILYGIELGMYQTGLGSR